jgi:hypothetical protein
MKIFPLPFMYCSNLSCKFSRQTQKKLVGFSHYGHFSTVGFFSRQMGCPALGIWVGFLKQPALPGKATPKKNSSKKILKNKKIINKKSQMNQK